MGKGWNNDGEKKKGSYRFIRLSNSGFIEFLSNPFQDFHTVWCLAHRINLVTRDLMDMKGINIVKAFSDWFLDNRRQTAYKKFIMQDSNRQRLRSIPQPSDTRWLFYRDVVSAILSQRNTVDELSRVMKDFWRSGTLWGSRKRSTGIWLSETLPSKMTRSARSFNLSSLCLDFSDEWIRPFKNDTWWYGRRGAFWIRSRNTSSIW